MGTTATDALISASHLLILNRFHRGAAMWLGIVTIIANLTGLAFLFYYFRTSCNLQYVVVPNDWEAIDTPAPIAGLEASEGLTIISTSLVIYLQC